MWYLYCAFAVVCIVAFLEGLFPGPSENDLQFENYFLIALLWPLFVTFMIIEAFKYLGSKLRKK